MTDVLHEVLEGDVVEEQDNLYSHETVVSLLMKTQIPHMMHLADSESGNSL